MSKVIKYLYNNQGDVTILCRRRIKRLKRKGLVVTIPDVFFLEECNYTFYNKRYIDIYVRVDTNKLSTIKQLNCTVYMSSGFKHYGSIYRDIMVDYCNSIDLWYRTLPAILVFKTKREATIGKMLAP